MQHIRHLVISGGGLKGIAFLGTLECLQRHDRLNFDTIHTFAGSSAGSILSVMLVCGFTVAEIFKVAYDVNVKELIDIDFSKLSSHFGVESGEKFLEIFQSVLTKKGIHPDITLRELHNLTGKHLIITATCIGKGVEYFDHVTEPDLSVLLAVRMSIGIPLVLTAVKYKGNYYVDGGVLDNMPIKALARFPWNEVLTLRTTPFSSKSNSITSFEDFVWHLGSTIFHEIDQLRGQECLDHHRNALIVPVDEHPSINIDNEQKKHLFKTGYLAAKTFLNSKHYREMRFKTLPSNVMERIWMNLHRERFRPTLVNLEKNTE